MTPRRKLLATGVAISALLMSLTVVTPADALSSTGTGGVFTAASGRVADGVSLKANTWTTVQIAGQAGVPDDGAGAVVLNATVSRMSGLGQLFGRPDSSTSSTLMMTYDGGDLGTTSGSATVAVADDGTIQVETNTTATLYLDVEGYYSSDDGGIAPGGFVPVAGSRIVDTRIGTGASKAQLKPGTSITVQVGGKGGVPATASGVVANLIAVNASADGYITPYTTGGAKPATSLHYASGTATSTSAQIALNSSGQLTVANTSATIDLVVDVEGYFTATAGSGAVFTPATGGVYDTRHTGNTAISANGTRAITVAGVNGVPTMASGITAVAITLTAIHAANSSGNATVWADGTTKPGTTAVNFVADSIRGNTVIVPLGSNGKIDLGNYGADSTDFQLELQGWYINPVAPTISCPSPYSAGTWTQTVPANDITCTVSMPNTGDTDGVITTSVNGGDSTDTAMSGSAASTVSVTVPAIAGWYIVDAVSSYSNGDGGESTYQFGIEHGAPSAAVAAIQHADPTEFQGISQAATTASGQVAIQTTDDSTGATGTVSTDPTTGITVATTGNATDIDTGTTSSSPTSLQLTLPVTAQTSSARVEATGVVSYDNGDGSTTVPIAKLDGSVQINTVLASSAAPKRYAYTATVPTGMSLSLGSDGGITATDAQGNIGGSISPAWAIDAAGNIVPTHYEIDGQTITQVLDLSSSSISYPVVADPWAGSSYVKKLKWEKVSKWSPTLAVTPTQFARQAPSRADDAMWNEIVHKASKANTPTMKTQFDCHFIYVRTVSPHKATWDLDSKRPNVSLAKEADYRCNYPDGGEVTR